MNMRKIIYLFNLFFIMIGFISFAGEYTRPSKSLTDKALKQYSTQKKTEPQEKGLSITPISTSTRSDSTFDPRKFLWTEEDIRKHQKPAATTNKDTAIIVRDKTREVTTRKDTEKGASSLLSDWQMIKPDSRPVPESIKSKQDEGAKTWYSRAYDTLSKSELGQQVKNYLIRQAKEKGPEVAAGLATTAAAVVAGAGYAAHNKIRDWWSGTSEEKIAPKEAIGGIDPYKQAFYAAEQEKIALAAENIDKGNLEDAVKIIREQQTMWQYLPDITKQDSMFERLVSYLDGLKQRLINTISASIETTLNELDQNTIAVVTSKEDMAKIYFENSLQAGNWKGAEQAIDLLEKEINAIKSMSEKITKLQHAIQAAQIIVTDEKFNDLVTALREKIATKYNQTALQELLHNTEASVAMLKNRLAQAQIQQTNIEQVQTTQEKTEPAITEQVEETLPGGEPDSTQVSG